MKNNENKEFKRLQAVVPEEDNNNEGTFEERYGKEKSDFEKRYGNDDETKEPNKS